MLKRCLKLWKMNLTTFDSKKDYYKVLNIPSKSSKQQIKASFHKLAKLYHPDANKGNDQKFKQLNEAYQILSDQQTKKNYDATRNNQNNFNQQQHQQQYQYQYYQNPNQSQQYQYPNRNVQTGNYRGYQKEQGWQNKKKRQEFINNVHQNQQNQYQQQYFYWSSDDKYHHDGILRHKNNTNNLNRTINLQEELKKQFQQHSKHFKTTRQKSRRMYEEQMKNKQQEFNQYKLRRQPDVKDQLKDKVQKMSQGFKQSVESAERAKQYIKQNISQGIKIGREFIKNLWGQYGNSKKK